MNRGMYIPIPILFVIMVFFLILGGLTTELVEKMKRSRHLPASIALGETSQSGPVRLTVHQVREDLHGAGPLTPPEGKKFIVAEVSIENMSTSSIQIAPLLHFHIRDNDGFVYSSVAVPSALGMYSGEILPGDILREEIGFAVRKDATNLRLYYEPGINGATTIVARLTR